jgi:hypothetical protein
VRSLAQRSAAAAKEIKELIDDSVDKVGSGSKLVEQAGVTMSDIVDSVQRVTQIVGNIADASEEQSAGITQVNQAISQMDQGTQQNAALVEEAAAAAQPCRARPRSWKAWWRSSNWKGACPQACARCRLLPPLAVPRCRPHARWQRWKSSEPGCAAASCRLQPLCLPQATPGPCRAFFHLCLFLPIWSALL